MTTPTIDPENHSPLAPVDKSLPTSTDRGAGWWLQVARVRLRFILIVVVAGVVVSQWSLVRSVWERWNWASMGKHPTGTVSGSQEYFCPMDPGVVSVWPAICPICNMDLVPRKKMDAVLLPEGVIARMQLSPYRVQLAGIRTTVIEPRALRFERRWSGVLRQLDDRLVFEASISPAEASYFPSSATIEVRSLESPQPVSATADLMGDAAAPRVRFGLDHQNSFALGTAVTATVSFPLNETVDVLAVPESAVIDRGNERLVYVESMPGMFDGVMVELGRRCGAYYPVLKGLDKGQKVATAGAFLIDAETRLNPSLAAGYFGANQGSPGPTAAPPPAQPPTRSTSPKSTPAKSSLSPEDQALADRQRICPVTELPLNSMGGPVPVMVSGRKVFICCKGCEKRLKDEPEKYLVRISPQ